MNLNLLHKQLGISIEKSDAENLSLLVKWVQDNLSHDIQFSGTEAEQLASYQAFIETCWTECFHPDKHTLLLASNEHVIFACALLGLDNVINTLHPNPEQLNKQNRAGMSALHLAAVKGHVHTVNTLLALGADAAILNHHSQYPIFSALVLPIAQNERLKTNKTAIFKQLQTHDATTIGHQDDNGDTVLQQLALHDFPLLLNEVLTQHAELAYIPNHHTHYPIHTAVLNAQANNVKRLLALKDVALLTDSNGWVALHYAARAGTLAVLDYCCQATPNIDTADEQGRTPLMLAATLGNLPNMITLIQYGASVKAVDSYHFTVLHHAVDSGHENIVRWLLANTDVNVNTENYQQKTALAISELNGNHAIKSLLLE